VLVSGLAVHVPQSSFTINNMIQFMHVASSTQPYTAGVVIHLLAHWVFVDLSSSLSNAAAGRSIFYVDFS
jgi:hypothetical protein